jgi:hypothetical protein
VARTVFVARARPKRASAVRYHPRRRSLVEPEKCERRGEPEDRRERVLLLRDPGDRLDADRVERECCRREQRARQVQGPQQPEEQEGHDSVEADIGQMVAQGRVAPESVLDPECTVEERVVLLGRSGLKPDPPESVQGAQVRSGDVPVVVPDLPPKLAKSSRSRRSKKLWTSSRSAAFALSTSPNHSWPPDPPGPWVDIQADHALTSEGRRGEWARIQAIISESERPSFTSSRSAS